MHTRQMITVRKFALLAALVTLLAAVGCKEETVIEPDHFAPDPNLPPAVVDLPPAPPASAFVIPEHNADGSLRVEGLIAHQDNHLDKDVEVRGEIVSISPECDPAKAKKQNTECPEPHMLIKDDRDSSKQLLVVGFTSDFIKKSKIKAGGQHLFKGNYRKHGSGFVASEDGLLVLSAIDEAVVAVAEK